MIYVIINDLENTKRDCRTMRQPLNLLTGELKEYVENTKNEKIKSERIASYSTLLISLKELFSIENPEIERNENGKPYLKGSEIYFSISHSDGLAAVALSDSREIGIDLQCSFDKDKEEKIDKRFLKDIKFKNDNIDIKYFLLLDGTLKYYSPEISLENDFLFRWTFVEANIKCRGLNFSKLKEINELSKSTHAQTVKYKNCKITTVIAD